VKEGKTRNDCSLSVARIARVAAALRAGIPASPDDAGVIAEAFERIVAGEPDVAAALSLKLQQGARRWNTALSYNRRNQLIRSAAEQFFPAEMSTSEQARQLHRDLSRYAESSWKRERLLDECPSRLVGNIRALCWSILKAHEYVLSERAIRYVLATKPQISLPENHGMDSLGDLA
jgi:hypothetical protein